jgi:nicotinamidase/pyrazinamidase
MKTLIITDVQNDFLPGGALGIAKADEIIPVINALIPTFDHVIATQDWHPPHHISFASTHHKKVGERIFIDGIEQILWPDHCIQHTKGAELSSLLKTESIAKVFHKGTDPKIDSYSAFFDNARRRHTGLESYLRKNHLTDLFFVGLATDYCVLYSVLDALELGFNVTVIAAGCRPVNLKEGDGERALQIMRSKGAHLKV